jgi:hypothetical protein
MGHSRKDRVRARDMGEGIPFPPRLDRTGFAKYAKLEAKHLTAAVKADLQIESIHKLCWVCISCGHRNGCAPGCTLKTTKPGKFSVKFERRPSAPDQQHSPPAATDELPYEAEQVPLEEIPIERGASTIKQQSDYVLKFTKEHFIPRTKGDGGQMNHLKLKENGIFSDSFFLPHPRIFPDITVGGVSIQKINAAWGCGGDFVKLVDYELFEKDCDGFKCECQFTKKEADPTYEMRSMQRHGTSSHVRVDDGGYGGISRFYVLVEYQCKNCELAGNASSSIYNTLSPVIIGQLSKAAQASIDFFVLSNKTIVSRATQTLIMAHMEQGGSGFANLADISLRVVGTELVRFKFY